MESDSKVDSGRREADAVVESSDVRISIDNEKCIGIGSCVTLAPDLFEIADSGKAIVLIPEPGDELHDLARSAEAGCPTDAIVIS